MSVFHRIGPADPMADDYPLDSATFFKLARRLFAYKGVMRAYAEAEGSKNGSTHSPAPGGASTVPMTDPSVSQYFEVD